MIRRHFFVVAVCALLVPLASLLGAATLEWNKATGTPLYVSTNNWDPNQIPTENDDVVFGLNLAGIDVDILLGATSVADDVTFYDGIVEFLDVGGSELNNIGLVTIDDVAATALGNGAQVTLNAATWDSVGDARVGDVGFGRLTVNNQAEFTLPSLYVGDDENSVGEVNVDGPNSILTADAVGAAFGIFIGNAGAGAVNVTDGGLMQTTDLAGAADISIGFAATGEGSLNISGAGSRVIAEDFLVGEGGTGHLMVSAGGVMDTLGASPDAFMGHLLQSSGDATVTGDNSRWNARNLLVGNQGDSVVNISAGGRVNATGLVTLGDDSTNTGSEIINSSGAVTVSGSGTTEDSLLSVGTTLTVGNGGQGALEVNSGGDVTVGDDLNIGNNAAATFNNVVAVTGAGSTISVVDHINVGLAGKGDLNATAGGHISGRFLRVGDIAGTQGNLLVDGANSAVDISASSGNTAIGTRGVGTVMVSDEASLTTNTLWVGFDDNGNAEFTIDNATVTSGFDGAGDLFIGGGLTGTGIVGGTGVVTVQNGGLLVANDHTYLGGNSGGVGTLTVTGAGSKFDADSDSATIVRVGGAGAGTLNISAGGTVEAAAMRVGDSAGSQAALVTIDGSAGASRLDVIAAINVGQERKGTLTITGGGVLTSGNNDLSTSTIGVGAASDGSTVTVDGAGSLWDNQGASTRLSIGRSGGANVDGLRSSLQVTGGGKVLVHDLLVADGATGGVGELVIDGADGANVPSTVSANGFVVIGDDSLGLLTVSGGGLLENTVGSIEIGGTASGLGVATVTGAGSTINVADFFIVGRSNDGALVIADGGTVNNTGDGMIGRDNGAVSTVTVGSNTADPSSWNNGASLYVGGDEFGAGAPVSVFVNPGGTINVNNHTKIWSGTLNIQGGTFATDSLEIVQLGDLAFDTGTLRFTGDGGYSLNSSNLNLIFSSDPKTLEAGQHLAIDNNAMITAPLRINGGTLSVGAATKADLALVDFDAGTINITGSGIVVTDSGIFGGNLVIDEDEAVNTSGGLFVQSDGLLSVARGSFSAAGGVNDGTIVITQGTADFGSGLANDGDLVLIDAATSGTITNNGELTVINTAALSALSLQGTGSLSLSLHGTEDFDSLSIAGDASLGGLLDVDVSGFQLGIGETFEILDIAGTAAGTFAGLANESLVGNFGGVDLFIDYEGGDGNDVVLFTSANYSADFDGDGDVDGDDLAQWESDFGGPGSDADNDGDSDGADVLAWLRQFGSGTSPLAATQTVPEPSAVALVLIAAIAVSQRRMSFFYSN